MERKIFLRNIAVCILSGLVLLFAFSSCTDSIQAEKPLWILTEKGYYGAVTLEENYERTIDYFCYLYGFSREDINLEFLPEAGSEREVCLAALRTEIMSGYGPDVFLLNASPTGKRWNEAEAPPQLFPDVQKAMDNRLFLPLDNYLKNARYLAINQLLSTVLEAGKTNEGQVVLPITFTFPYAVYEKNKLSNLTCQPHLWTEGMNEENSAIRDAYCGMAENQFSSIFPQVADYSTEKLSFSREELQKIVKQCLEKREAGDAEQENALLTVDLFQTHNVTTMFTERYYEPKWQGAEIWDVPLDEYRRDIEENPQVITALYNTDGGLTAGITSYVCVNRNTKRPEDAFKVVDFLFKTEIQSCQGERNTDDTRTYQTFLLYDKFGIPARNDLLKNELLSFKETYFSQLGPYPGERNEEVFSEYTALRNEVTHARFYGTLDQELQTMYEACLEAETDEEVEKIVSKAYDTMLMILAES